MKRFMKIGNCFLDMFHLEYSLKGTIITSYPSQRLPIKQMKDYKGSYLAICFKKDSEVYIKVKNNKEAEEIRTKMYNYFGSLVKINELERKIKKLNSEVCELRENIMEDK